MIKKTYHKFEIAEQSFEKDGCVVGVDPIEMEGAFGLSDEIYDLLCKLSTCIVCGKPAQALADHCACVREPDPTIHYFHGIAFPQCEGKLGFFIPKAAYTEQFVPAYNRDRYHRAHSKRAYRRAQNGGSHTVKDVCALLKCQRNRCYYCFIPFDENGEGGYHFHRDHMQPLAGGGSDDIENIALTCASCNMDKGGEDWDSFLARRAQRLAAADRGVLLAIHRQVEDWKRDRQKQLPDAHATGQTPAPGRPGPSHAAPGVARQCHGGLGGAAKPPERHLRLVPNFVPYCLERQTLQRWIEPIGPIRWKNLAAAARRAAAYTCSICQHDARAEDAHGLVAYEEWVYSHTARPATARLEQIRCICFRCYSVRHIDWTRQMVETGMWKKDVLDDAITHFCKVNACDATDLDELERWETEMRCRNMHVFYELVWGRFEPLLGKRIRQEHEFTLALGNTRHLESHKGPKPWVGDVPLPIPDGWSVVHVVPLFDAARNAGARKNATISELLAIDGALSPYGERAAQVWRGQKYAEFREAAECELERRRGRRIRTR